MQLLIDARLLSQGEGTGVETYAKNVISRLLAPALGRECTLFYNAWRTAPLPDGWHANAKRIVNWGIPNKLYDLWQPQIDRYLPTDVIYSPHINRLRSAKAPRVITIHDLSFIHYPQFFPLKYRIWHARQHVKEQAYEAAAIVANSTYTKADIISTWGIAPEKIRVVWPGIDAPTFTHDARHSMSPAKLELLKRPYLLCLSTLEPRKNIPLALSAFAHLKKNPRYRDLVLILAGGKSWRFKPITYPDVIYWGGVSAEEKALLYTEAEALLFPSFFEGFGFPPLEAQSYGCPVVASDRSSLPEILGASALLVSPWNARELADAISTILDNPGTRDHLIAAGHTNARRFDWNATLCALSNIFSSLAARP